MKKLLFLTLSCALLVPFYSCKKSIKVIKKNYDFKIQTIIGSAKIESKGKNRVPVIDETLKAGETIITEKKSIVDLLYGKRGLIRINENSKVTVSELNEKTGGDTQIRLGTGKLYITISKLTKGTQFKVNTPTTMAAIRGTTFRITTEKESTRLDVISGKVKVNPAEQSKVIEDVEWNIETKETIHISSNTVNDIALKIKKAKEIKIKKINPEAMAEIKKEVKDIKQETLAKLHTSTRTEFKINTLEMKKEVVKKEERKIEAFQYEDEVDRKKKKTLKQNAENDKKQTEIDAKEKKRIKTKSEKERKKSHRFSREKAEKKQDEKERLAQEKKLETEEKQKRKDEEAAKKLRNLNLPANL